MAVTLVAAAALAAPAKLIRPVSVQEGRWNALHAAGVKNVWRGNHHVTLMGLTRNGTAVVMVKSQDLQKPAIVAMKAVQGKYGREVKATALDGAAMKKLGLVTPSQAFLAAIGNGGLFGKVKGQTKFAGASNKGFAYKLTVTPKKPAVVKASYGTYTISELTRMVNALGNGETAYPTPGKYSYKYGRN